MHILSIKLRYLQPSLHLPTLRCCVPVKKRLSQSHSTTSLLGKMNNLLFMLLALYPWALCDSLLTSKACSELRSDQAKLYSMAEDTMMRVDEHLKRSKEVESIAEGFVVTIVDEEDGIDAGGGTNTLGSYNTAIFNGTQLYPGDMCEAVPGLDGKPRCGYTESFLLGPSDVMVFYMCSPPPVRYFSHDLILAVRLTEEYPFYPGQNFGNAISHLSIQVDNNESVFDEPFVIVHAFDEDAAKGTTDAFLSAGVPQSQINVRYISPSTIRFWDRSNGQASNWKETSPDILGHIGRVSVPLDGYEEHYNLYKNVSWPARVYFADDDTIATNLIEPLLPSRYTANIVDEISMLNDTLALLYDAVLEKWTSSENLLFMGTQTVNLSSLGYYDDWDQILALKNNESFVAGTRDATYGIPIGYFGQFNTSTSGTIIGVNHKYVNNISYNSVGLDLGSASGKYVETHWFLDEKMYGSAVRYLGEDNELALYLFAIDFYPPGGCGTSSVPSQWCVEFSPDSYDLLKLRKLYPIIGERMYTVHETALGNPANLTCPVLWLQFGS